MQAREKLFLVWALVATTLLVFAVIIAVQFSIPRTAPQAELIAANSMPLDGIALYTCNPGKGLCTPMSGISETAHWEAYRTWLATRGTKAHAAGEQAFVWVTRDGPTEWRAFSAVSTHLGCLVDWDESRQFFVDPCSHAYWQRSGNYQGGPAPRNLDYFTVVPTDESVKLDLKLLRGESHN